MLGIARQPYYGWRAEPVGDAEWDEAHLANAVFDAHRDDHEFGYRFLTDEDDYAGFDECERTVWRIYSEMGWWSLFGRKRPTGSSCPGGVLRYRVLCVRTARVGQQPGGTAARSGDI